MTAPVQRLRQEITIEYGEVLQATVDAADLAAVLDAAEAQIRLLEEARALIVSLTQFSGRAQHTALLLDQIEAALARWRELTGEVE